MRKNNIQQITKGAMLSAIIGVFMLLNTMTSLTLFAIFPYLIPIPFILYTKEYGYPQGIVMLVVVFILGIFLTPIEQVFLVAMYGTIGIVYGDLAKRNFSDKPIILLTFVGTIIIYAIMMFLFSSIYGFDIIGEMKQLTALVNEMMQARPELLPSIQKMIRPIVLMSFVMSAFLEAIVIHYLVNILFLFLKIKPIPKVKWSQVKYPQALGLLAAVMALGGLWADQNKLLKNNSEIMLFLSILGFVYLGFLGLIFFYSQEKLKRFRLYSIIVLLFTLDFYAPVHVGIGLFTSITNYWRKGHE